jgi:regulator of sigma E protease
LNNPDLSKPEETAPGGEPSFASGSGGEAVPPDGPHEGRGLQFVGEGLTLALLAILVVWLLKKVGVEGLLNIGLVALGLSFVVFIHELGHFLVAKWCDVHVETFSIGFGPAIPGCSFRWGETVYKLAWFPLGGYVKMVGEGTENEEDADDPRSFKNKSVWQRMAIISAGVVMNVILGFVCFIAVFMTHGVEHSPAEVEAVDAGSPAWKKGVPSGAVIEDIGGIVHPYFDDLIFKVKLSSWGEFLRLAYHRPGLPGRLEEIEIEPRKEDEDVAPLIGVAPPPELKLPEKRMGYAHPVRANTPAAHASPAFEFGDKILGTTDPDQPEAAYRPDKVKLLPLNTRDPEEGQADYFEFWKRLKRLAGKTMVMQVQRQNSSPGDPLVNITVPPAWHYTFGTRMRMGQISAIREGSPAAGAGLVPLSKGVEGDVLKQVEVVEPGGRKLRYITTPSKPATPGVIERELDPLRLPYELEQWAARRHGEKKVILTVLRQEGAGHAPTDVVRELRWDDRWNDDREVPQYPSSPLPIPGLGLAYKIDAVVDAVQENSPAAKAALERGDLIKAIRFQEPGAEPGQSVPGEWIKLGYDQWPYAFRKLQETGFKEVTLRIERRAKEVQEVTLVAEPDKSWPQVERGLILQLEARMQRADGLGQAVALGVHHTFRVIVTLYRTLRAVATKRISPRYAFGGPIAIAEVGYASASQGPYHLLLFLGMISINLAVINFLPIPVLDGGHMIFLIYEKLRGTPSSESMRAIATYVGLILILALMAFVFWIDISRMF